MDLKDAIRSVKDFPIEGVVFRDITTLLNNSEAYNQALDEMQAYCEKKIPDSIIGIESRGFIFGAALADRLGIGFIPVRKAGKLPSKTIKYEYKLEYGTDTIEIHADALKEGQSAVVVDDLIATGGTLDATCKLVEKIGAKVAGITVLVELAYLPWRDKVGDREVFSLIKYNSE